MPTEQNLLTATYGGDVTTSMVTFADRGFTANSLTAATDGFSTTSDLKLLTGFTPVKNASTQILTLSNLNVDSNSGTDFVLAIHPNGTTTGSTTNTGLYRKRISSTTDTELESMNLNSDLYDRSQYLFSSTTLGVDDLEIGGTVYAAQTGSRHFSTTAPTTYSTTTGTAVVLTDNYGSWKVNIIIQALLTNYASFLILAGSPLLADDVLETLDNAPVKFSLMTGVADSAGNFINDFLVDVTKYQIVKQFTTTNVKLYARSVVPEGMIVKFADYVYASITGATANVDLNNTTNFMQYNYGVYPIYTFKLSRESVVDVAVDLYDGCVAPGGQVVPIGSNTNDDSTSTNSLVLPDVKADPEFILPSGVALTGVILMDDYFILKKGLNSSLFQPVCQGLKTTEDLDMDGVQFPPLAALESDMIVESAMNILDTINIARGSVIKKGSRFPATSQTLEGALIENTITIAQGSTVTSRVDISNPFVVESSTSGSNSIKVGAVLKGPFTFSIGTNITSGNVLPASLKLLMTMGVTLAANMKLPAGTTFGSNAMLYGDVGFSPTGSIPAGSTLIGSGWTFPVATKLSAGFVATFSIPIPAGTVIQALSTLYKDTTFKEGASLSFVEDLGSQAGAVTSSSPNGPLVKFVENSITYLVIKAGTVFMPSWKFPVGTVLSKQATAGATDSLTLATSGTYADLATLVAGAYSLDEGNMSPAQEEFNFVPGTATTSLVVMLTDTTLPTDVLIPSDQIELGSAQYLSFSEPVTLINDIVLSSVYTVHSTNNVFHPPNYPIQTDFNFTSSYTFNAGAGSQISKTIHLNTHTTSEFIHGIMASGASLKLPAAGFILDQPIQLAVAQQVANTGSNPFKSTVTLVSGTTLSTSAPVPLIVPMHVTSDFTVGADLLTFPRMRLEAGIILLTGHTTPGPIVIGAGSALLKSLTLTQEITLASDLVVKELTYAVLQYAYLAPGSVLARGSNFPSGANIVSKVTMGPILSLASGDVFNFFEGEALLADLHLPYLYENGAVCNMVVDSRDLIVQNANLQNSLAALEAAVAALQNAQ